VTFPASVFEVEAKQKLAKGKEQDDCSICDLLGLFFEPENRAKFFLRNISELPSNYMALYPRREFYSVFFISSILYSNEGASSSVSDVDP
jgi:hypothetical protein